MTKEIDHHCVQERKIGEMDATLNRIDKEMFNGDGGLIKIVPVLAKTVESLDQSVQELRTVISAFSKAEGIVIGEHKKEDEISKSRMNGWKIFGIVFGALVGLFSIMGFVLALSSASVNKKESEEIDLINQKLRWKQDRVLDSTIRSIHNPGVMRDTTLFFIDMP